MIGEEFLSVHGTIVAEFDDDRYCGPNSAVKNIFKLILN